MHVVEQALDQQHVVDGAQPLGAFRVVGAHFMAAAVGVGDVGRQQIGLPENDVETAFKTTVRLVAAVQASTQGLIQSRLFAARLV